MSLTAMVGSLLNSMCHNACAALVVLGLLLAWQWWAGAQPSKAVASQASTVKGRRRKGRKGRKEATVEADVFHDLGEDADLLAEAAAAEPRPPSAVPASKPDDAETLSTGPVAASSPKPTTPVARPPPPFAEGARVEARWQGQPDWHPAVITKVPRNRDGTVVDLLYDDGITELGVSVDLVRLLGSPGVDKPEDAIQAAVADALSSSVIDESSGNAPSAPRPASNRIVELSTPPQFSAAEECDEDGWTEVRPDRRTEREARDLRNQEAARTLKNRKKREAKRERKREINELQRNATL